MQLSKYLKAWPCADNPGSYLLYSTRKTSLAMLPAEVFYDLKQGKIPDGYRDTLIRLDMLVDDPLAEKTAALQMLSELNRFSPGLSVAVILGMECNFACKYCYEGGRKGGQAMNAETADQLVAYLKKRFAAHHKKLTLDFYGGEPLLYTGRLKYIVEQVRPFVEDQGATFRFTLVSNGSLLTRKTVEELVPLGLKGAKITVDGPPENHNYFRPFKSGRPSFDIVMNNIRECCGLTEIAVGGNFTRDNYKLFPALLDHFEVADLGRADLAEVGFAPALQVNDESANHEFCSGCVSVNEPWLVDAALLLREEIMKRGYKTSKMGPAPCMVDLENSFTVHYNGDIYKCPALIGQAGFSVGDVQTGCTDYRQIYQLDNLHKEEKCRDCEYLPLCLGGCRYMKYQRDGDMAGVDCQKEFLGAVLEPMIKQDVKYRPAG